MRLTIINGIFAAVGLLSFMGSQDKIANADSKTAATVNEIRARSIVLVDESGSPRITMLANRNAAGIWVGDGKQNAAIYVNRGAQGQGPVISLMDERNVGKGAPLAFSLDGNGKPHVQIVDDGFHSFDAKNLAPKGD